MRSHEIEPTPKFLFSGSATAAVVGLAVAAASVAIALNKFDLGSCFFAIGGVWVLGYWFCGADPIIQRRQAIEFVRNAKMRRNAVFDLPRIALYRNGAYCCADWSSDLMDAQEKARIRAGAGR
jgi:hypothetical protein